MSAVADVLRRPFGRPLRRRELPHQVLAKKYALPVFASDALSSVAYATEEILKVLALVGTAYFFHSMWISLLITGMLLVLLLSYRQTIFAYPNGGGAYIVARDNIGEGVAQLAGAALLIDYILTVSVSIAAGVANFASGVHQFLPSVPDFNANARVIASILVLFVMWYVNKRGVRESGRAFAAPTYFFLAATLLMLGVGFVESLTGHLHHVQGVSDVIRGGQSLTLFLILRAFASGSTAATGIEAISNGITAFEEPKSKNAATVMFWMIALLGLMFVGITRLALVPIQLDSHKFGEVGCGSSGLAVAPREVARDASAASLMVAVVGDLQGELLQRREVRFDGVEPTRVGRREDRLHVVLGEVDAQRRVTVRVEIVHDDVQPDRRGVAGAQAPKDGEDVLVRLPLAHLADETVGMHVVEGEQLLRPLEPPVGGAQALGTANGGPAPAMQGAELQRAALVVADHRPARRRRGVEFEEGVFFTSKSGSGDCFQVLLC